MKRNALIGLVVVAFIGISSIWSSRRQEFAQDERRPDAVDRAPANPPRQEPRSFQPMPREAARLEASTPEAALPAVAMDTAGPGVMTTPAGYTFRAGTDERMPRHSGVSELRSLSRKAIKRAADRERERQLLEDRDVLEHARRIFEFEGAVAGTDTGTVVRAAQLEVFAAALAAPANPQREFLRQTLLELVGRRIDPKILTGESRQAIATDRVVLFRLLSKHFPEAADALRGETRDARLQRLFDYATSLPPDDRGGA